MAASEQGGRGTRSPADYENFAEPRPELLGRVLSISVSKDADLVVLSADYSTVPDDEISHIESVLTITGGKIVYAAADYEGFAAPLSEIRAQWSPVARFGAYQATPSDVRQAEAIIDAVTEPNEYKT